MRALTASSILGLLLLAAPASHLSGYQDAGHAQDPGVYRVNVRLVLVDAQVVNKKTHQVVSSLQRDDLRIYEDGVRQQISSFSQDELPLSVVLLFDLTDSVRPVLKPLAASALAALQHFKPQDEVAVMVYAASTRVIQDFTTDRSLTAAAIDKASRMESGEAAFFNEAIYQASGQLSHGTNPNSRRVIIWLTDDVPNIPSEEVKDRYGRSLRGGVLHTEKEALKELFRTGVVVCTLLMRSEISDQEDSLRDSSKIIGRMLYPPGEVYKYAQASGGEVVESNSRKLPAKLAQLIDDIRTRYSLGYHPSMAKPKGKFCAIKVDLAAEVKKAQKDLVVQAKQGYYR
ncbi:MAG TPA: VWA domain-containing protein [Candidatus Angelobacter sp.]